MTADAAADGASAPFDTLAARLPRLTLVVGKGGVGKTTCAAAIAARLAASGERTLLLSTDPAGTLGTALGVPLGADAQPVPDRPTLAALQLSATESRQRFLARWRDTIVTIVDRGTYLDSADLEGLVDAALPGADEIFALLALADLERASWTRLVADTAPTGHTLRLLALPQTFEALVSLLDRMQEKHRFMVRALTHRYRRDAADDFIDRMRATIGGLRATLADPARAGAVLVARAEPVVVAETERYAAALAQLGVRIAGVVVNAVPAEIDDATRAALARLERVAPEATRVMIARAEAPLVGVAAIEMLMALGARRSAEGRQPSAESREPRAESRAPSADSLLRTLTIVGGKGGVGKTTVSCALALLAADAGARVLLVSTDPAPSIADALGQPIGDEEVAVADAPGLVARQMDAGAAFARLRESYQARIDALFEAITGRGVDLAADRAILRDLLALAPPGIDELYALASLGETLFDADAPAWDRIVVDPAPTGHLLRLLEMPAIALQWSHQLMRLLLKYREVAGLGDLAQELLAFARRTRALDALLHDGARATLVAVTLDEPLVRGETARLVAAVAGAGVGVEALVWNRWDGDGMTPLPLPPVVAPRQLAAPRSPSPLVGAAALRAWARRWATPSSAPSR